MARHMYHVASERESREIELRLRLESAESHMQCVLGAIPAWIDTWAKGRVSADNLDASLDGVSCARLGHVCHSMAELKSDERPFCSHLCGGPSTVWRMRDLLKSYEPARDMYLQ